VRAAESPKRNLAALVPDNAFRAVIALVLTRPQSLGIRPISFDVLAHVKHDPGCFTGAAGFLRPFQMTHERAIVLFDRHGSGGEVHSASELEEAVGSDLGASGWGERAQVVVLDPELEVWAWGDSPHVERCLGWVSKRPSLRQWLENKGLWTPGALKPSDPKEAMALALRETASGPPGAVFPQLAQSVGLRRCTDRAFVRFRGILQQWFPAESRHAE
jgi:hypothetical protein